MSARCNVPDWLPCPIDTCQSGVAPQPVPNWHVSMGHALPGLCPYQMCFTPSQWTCANRAWLHNPCPSARVNGPRLSTGHVAPGLTTLCGSVAVGGLGGEIGARLAHELPRHRLERVDVTDDARVRHCSASVAARAR